MKKKRMASNLSSSRKADVTLSSLHPRVAIILVSPRISENIGATARAMKNFAFSDLRIVAPRNYDSVKAKRMARGGSSILDNAKYFDTLNSALADLTFVAATTARTGNDRSTGAENPDSGTERLLAEAEKGYAGLLFGPEERGLTNRELDNCQLLLTIPTNPDFSSLNLAQAVVIMLYEMSKNISPANFHKVKINSPRQLATSSEIEGLFSSTKEFLLEAGFLNPQNPDSVLLHLRKLLARAEASPHEIKTLRGILRQVSWYARQSQKE